MSVATFMCHVYKQCFEFNLRSTELKIIRFHGRKHDRQLDEFPS